MLFAHGSRFGGHALFTKDKKLYYVYNILGIEPEQVFESNVALKPQKPEKTWSIVPSRDLGAS
jgi:hypothetical protein